MKTSIFDKHRDTLEHHETMMGTARGRLAVALDLLGNVAVAQGDHTAARSYYERSLEMFQESGNSGAVAITLNHLGKVAVAQGDCAGARPRFEQSLGIALDLGNALGASTSLRFLIDQAHSIEFLADLFR